MSTTTTVSSGGVTTQGSRTYLFGTSSGLNTSALVEVAYNARMAEADKLDIRVTSNTAKKDAYTQIQTLANAVQQSVASLRKNYGFSSDVDHSFDKRAGTLSSSNSTDPSKLLGVAIDAGTATGSYTLEVLQKATTNRIGSSQYASATEALGINGTFNIGLTGGAMASVSVTNGMTLTDLASAINAQTSTSGVSASILKVSSNSYQLILSGNELARDIAFAPGSGNNILESIGVSSGGVAANVLQAAQNAILKLDDVTITRESNQIDDLILGVNLTIQNAEPGTFMQLGITHDTSAIKNDIYNFVEAYNALREVVLTNQTVYDGGAVDEKAALFGDNILKSMNNEIQSLLSRSYGASANGITTLRDIGITLDGSNRMMVEDIKLDNALINHHQDVIGLFATDIPVSNNQFSIIRNNSKTPEMTFDIRFFATAAAIQNVTVNGQSGFFDITGRSVTGKAGTPYEGMTFAFMGTSNTTVHIDMKQGIANLFDNILKDYADTVTGSIAREKERLDDMNTSMNERITKITDRASEYRDKLIDKYAGYEAQIARSKSILSQLRAILGTDKKDD